MLDTSTDPRCEATLPAPSGLGPKPAPGWVQLLPWAVAALFAAGAARLFWVRPPTPLEERIPDRGNIEAAARAAVAGGPAEGRRVPGSGAASTLTGSWPQFRGETREGWVEASVSLARSWPAGGLPALWSVEVGEGYAGPVAHAGRVYLMDYDREEQADALRCLSLDDGREIWRFTYPVRVKRNHGMSRTVPCISGSHVVAIGPKCHVICVNRETGELIWWKDLVREYGTEVPDWYAGQCPLVENGRVILAPAGPEAMLVALEAATGAEVWKAPNPRGWKMTHSSIVPMEHAGRHVYLYCGSGGVVGVDAATGAALWSTDAWKVSIATIPSPVVLPGGRVFLSGGYDSGALMIRLIERDGRVGSEELFRLKARQFGATQHTPIWFQEHLYGIRPNGELICLNDAGSVLWASGTEHRYGLGPLLIAGDLIFALNEEGRLDLAEATPAGFRLLGSCRVLEGHEAWGPMALAGARLLVRDFTTLRCLDASHGSLNQGGGA